jgi:hypothetical protein
MYGSRACSFKATRLSQSIRYKATRRIRSITCLVNIGLDDQRTLYLSASYTSGAPLRPPPFLPFPRICPLHLSSTGATSHELLPSAAPHDEIFPSGGPPPLLPIAASSSLPPRRASPEVLSLSRTRNPHAVADDCLVYIEGGG